LNLKGIYLLLLLLLLKHPAFGVGGLHPPDPRAMQCDQSARLRQQCMRATAKLQRT